MSVTLPTAAHAYLDAHWDPNLTQTRELLRQQSISALPNSLRPTADLLKGWLEAEGAAVSYHGDEARPIVFAEWQVGAPKTLLVYGMYDVQPVLGQKWTTPPFSGRIWNHPEGGLSLVARGACNSKGPLMAFLHAVAALRATGGLPVNIKWTIEGEEEIGSLHLPEFYETHREQLQADAAFEAFWSQPDPKGPPRVTLGTKGVVGVEFICRAGEWGGPREVIHSSYGTVVSSPAWRLVQALSSLVDEHQNLRVEGIPALGVQLPGDEDLIRGQAATFKPQEYLRQLGVARFRQDLPVEEQLRRHAFAPVLNINGLEAGYQGEGSHTIIPNSARALCDLRMAPGMEVEPTLAALRRHLDAHGFPEVEFKIDSGYGAARTPVTAPVVQALIASYRAHGFEPMVRPMEASATPYYLYTDVLGLDFAWGGLGNAGGSHGPDEWCSVEGLKDLTKSVATFLTAFAEA